MAANNDFVVKNGLAVNGYFYVNTGIVALGANLVVNTSSLRIGNATANAVLNSISLIIGTTVVNTSQLAIGAASLATNQLIIGTTVVNTIGLAIGSLITINTSSYSVGNSVFYTRMDSGALYAVSASSNVVINASSILLGTTSLVNTSAFWLGNSSVNNSITSSNISLSGVVTINSSAVAVGGNVAIGLSSLSIGNSSVNVFSNSSTIVISGSAVVLSSRQVATSGLASGGGDLSTNRTITVSAAANTDFLGKTDTSKALTTGAVWNSMNEKSVAYAATVTLDLSSSIDFAIGALTGGITLANPTNVTAGQRGRIRLLQDASGGRLITFGTNWKFVGGVDPSLSTAGNAVDYLDYDCRSATDIRGSLSKGWA